MVAIQNRQRLQFGGHHKPDHLTLAAGGIDLEPPGSAGQPTPELSTVTNTTTVISS
ncbi:MAG TPA: hypothetical protein VMW47_12005 [Verrucomicrobiae bacterium]|nr:hypothetical protein [Verrucomicrobiae bacterium]